MITQIARNARRTKTVTKIMVESFLVVFVSANTAGCTTGVEIGIGVTTGNIFTVVWCTGITGMFVRLIGGTFVRLLARGTTSTKTSLIFFRALAHVTTESHRVKVRFDIPDTFVILIFPLLSSILSSST
jgi:hypothetical protein